MRRGWAWAGVSLVVFAGCVSPRTRGSMRSLAPPPAPRPWEEHDVPATPPPATWVGPDPSDCPTGDELLHGIVFGSDGYGCPLPARRDRPPSPAIVPYPDDYPPRPDIASAMRAVVPRIRACGAGQPWRLVEVTIHFTSAGNVSGVRVWRGFGAIPLGDCVAAAARTARLPPFRSDRFSVTFPFPLGAPGP